MEENQDPFPKTETQEVAEKPKPKELTIEFLQEKLEALEEAFEPFYNECRFYAVDIGLQGHFNSIITKTAIKMDYKSEIDTNGYASLAKGKIRITLT